MNTEELFIEEPLSELYHNHIDKLKEYSKLFTENVSAIGVDEELWFPVLKDTYDTLILCRSSKPERFNLDLDLYISFIDRLYDTKDKVVWAGFWTYLSTFKDVILNWNDFINTRQITCIEANKKVYSDYVYKKDHSSANIFILFRILLYFGLLKQVTNEAYLNLDEFLLLNKDETVVIHLLYTPNLLDFIEDWTRLLGQNNPNYSFVIEKEETSNEYRFSVTRLTENNSPKYYYLKELELYQEEYNKDSCSSCDGLLTLLPLVSTKNHADNLLCLRPYTKIVDSLHETYKYIDPLYNNNSRYTLTYREDYYTSVFKGFTNSDIKKLSKLESLLANHIEYSYFLKLDEYSLSLHDCVQLAVSLHRVVNKLYKEVRITTKENKMSFLYGFSYNVFLNFPEYYRFYDYKPMLTFALPEALARKDFTSVLYRHIKKELQHYQTNQTKLLKQPFDLSGIVFKGGWEVVELITVALLAEEGAYQNHCVGGYGGSVESSVRIFSFRRNNIRHACLFQFYEAPNRYKLEMNEGYYRKHLSDYTFHESSYLEYNIRLLENHLTESVRNKNFSEI